MGWAAFVIFIVFGGEILGPIVDYISNAIDLRCYLVGCAPDEMRLRFYSNSFEVCEGATVNLSTGKISVAGGELDHYKWGLFWQTQVQSIYHTINWPLMDVPAPLSATGVAIIQRHLQTVSTDLVPVILDKPGNKGCIAFYRDGKLQVAEFEPGKAPAELAEICQIIGFSPIFNVWNTMVDHDE